MSGNARYAAARRKALQRTGDPQHTTGGDPRARVAVLARMCGCGHSRLVHNTEHVKPECTVATGAGPCGCRGFTLKPDDGGTS